MSILIDNGTNRQPSGSGFGMGLLEVLRWPIIETLVLLRKVLDEAWAALPDGSKSETVLKQAADGVRDPVRLRASALAGAVGERAMQQQRRRFKQQPSPPLGM